jgi:hypothetical protein
MPWVKYVIYVEEGQVGGSAEGPASVGYPSSLRIVVEKPGGNKFRMLSTDPDSALEPANDRAQLRPAAQKLFRAGFREIEYDGITLDVKLYPFSFNDPFNANFLTGALSSVENIVEAIQAHVRA